MKVPDLNLRHLLQADRLLHRKDVWTVILLVVAVVLPFLHLKFGPAMIDGFINCHRPMETRWYVYFLSHGVAQVSFGGFVYRAITERFRPFAWLWLWYCVYDLILFFWCFNEKNYYYIPYAILLVLTFKLYKK
jgi:hypothetical protein